MVFRFDLLKSLTLAKEPSDVHVSVTLIRMKSNYVLASAARMTSSVYSLRMFKAQWHPVATVQGRLCLRKIT